MERRHLICMLIGRHSALGHTTVDSIRYEIDQDLLKCCFTPIDSEDGDLQLLDELLGETMMYVIGQGINRKQRRSKK